MQKRSRQNNSESNCVGNAGLGDRNDRGQMLIDFAMAHELSVMNTYF